MNCVRMSGKAAMVTFAISICMPPLGLGVKRVVPAADGTSRMDATSNAGRTACAPTTDGAPVAPMLSNMSTMRAPALSLQQPSQSVMLILMRSLRVLCVLCADRRVYQPRIFANMSGAQMVASDSMTNFGVSADSFPQVIFSFGTAPEYEP